MRIILVVLCENLAVNYSYFPNVAARQLYAVAIITNNFFFRFYISMIEVALGVSFRIYAQGEDNLEIKELKTKGRNRRASFFCNFTTPTIITPFTREAVFLQIYSQQ